MDIGRTTDILSADNIRDFFRDGLSTNNYLSVTGGSAKVQTYLSYTHIKVNGIIPSNDLRRHTFTLRASNQVSDRFSILMPKLLMFSSKLIGRILGPVH